MWNRNSQDGQTKAKPGLLNGIKIQSGLRDSFAVEESPNASFANDSIRRLADFYYEGAIMTDSRECV